MGFLRVNEPVDFLEHQTTRADTQVADIYVRPYKNETLSHRSSANNTPPLRVNPD